MKNLFFLILFFFSINCYSDIKALSAPGYINTPTSDTAKYNQIVKVDSFDENIIPLHQVFSFIKME